MSTSSASARGWGRVGAPGSATGRTYHARNIVNIHTSGITVACHRLIAPLLKAAVDECTAKGYRFDKVKDDWGWSHRWIRGRPGVLSNHSWGLAVDLNATKNPMTTDGKNHTDMPAWVVATMQKYGFSWGGNYRAKRRDPMHYEMLGTPASVKALVGALGLHPWP